MLKLKHGDLNDGDIDMTLAEVLPAARQLSAIEKLKLIRILVEDLDTAEAIAPLEPFKTYHLPTPYDSFGAGAVLMDALKPADSDRP
jgi:hypothetical protein